MPKNTKQVPVSFMSLLASVELKESTASAPHNVKPGRKRHDDVRRVPAYGPTLGQMSAERSPNRNAT